MTFPEARSVSKTNALHVRRAAWSASRWAIYWRGVWFLFDTGISRVFQAGDYSDTDLLATDWTTVPEPLVSCPVVPGSPGGGAPPSSGFPGLIGGTSGASPGGGPGGSGGGGSGAYGPTPPPPADAKGLTVTFSGLKSLQTMSGPPAAIDPSDIDQLNGPWPLTRFGFGTWVGYKTAVIYGSQPGGDNLQMQWKVVVTATDYGDSSQAPYHWTVTLFWLNIFGGHASAGGFSNASPVLLGTPINNDETAGVNFVGDGTASIGN
jgi:hypothetical protein